MIVTKHTKDLNAGDLKIGFMGHDEYSDDELMGGAFEHESAEELVDDDEISVEEEAFMRGYEEASTPEDVIDEEEDTEG